MQDAGTIILQFLDLTKWFWVFFVLWPLFKSTWIGWRQFEYEHSPEFRQVMFEMRIPREVRKSPRAMEQVLMGLHSLRNTAGDFEETWIDGEITKWFTLEICSFSGEVKFFIRCYYKQRPLVEAAFFSYYPDVELVEVDDYINDLPKDMDELYEKGYQIWGAEMLLRKEPAYPIRTYPMFEAPDEERQYDPIALSLEVLAKAKKGEFIGVQYLIAPAEDDWDKEWKPLVEKLKEQSSKKQGAESAKVATKMSFPGGPLPVFETGGGENNPLKSIESLRLSRTPGETNVLEAVENNLAKPAFHTIARFIYISPSPLYYDSFARRGIAGMFNQYQAVDLNGFKRNDDVSTRVKVWNWPHIFPGVRAEYRRASMLWHYRHRQMPFHTGMSRFVTSNILRWSRVSKTMILNVEAIATLFHPPTYIVLTAPHIRRLESRKTGPPAGLPIYGSEKDIEQFQ